MATLSTIRCGMPGLGWARSGVAWQGLQTAVRRARPPYCSLGSRLGPANCGKACMGPVLLGLGRCGYRRNARAVSCIAPSIQLQEECLI